MKGESYCYPAQLIKQLESYERWALGVDVVLAVNATAVVALLAYILCSHVCCSRRLKDMERGDYSHLISFNPKNKSPENIKIEYTDQVTSRRSSFISNEDDD